MAMRQNPRVRILHIVQDCLMYLFYNSLLNPRKPEYATHQRKHILSQNNNELSINKQKNINNLKS